MKFDMRFFTVAFLAIAIAFGFALLTGCADSSTRSGDDKAFDTRITINAADNAAVYIVPRVDAIVSANEETGQDTANTADARFEGKIPIALKGATAGTDSQSDVKSEYDDHSKSDSENVDKKTNTSSQVIPEESKPEQEIIEKDIPTEPTHIEADGVSISMKKFEDKSMAWLYDLGKPSELSGSLRFVFDGDCGEFSVPDASETYYDEGRDGYVFFAGKFEEGSSKEWTHGDVGSVFTRKGCVASSVTVYSE